jgi:mono/diheme cytochrome c family protein
MVIGYGFVPPPSFHSDRVRAFADGYVFDVITNGIRNMPAYGPQIPPGDRWAIVAYLRALQRSQNARLQDVPEDARNELK